MRLNCMFAQMQMCVMKTKHLSNCNRIGVMRMRFYFSKIEKALQSIMSMNWPFLCFICIMSVGNMHTLSTRLHFAVTFVCHFICMVIRFVLFRFSISNSIQRKPHKVYSASE